MICLAGALSSAFALQPAMQKPAQEPSRPAYLLTPEAIYSSDPQDPWNRIFSLLFSRRFETRLSADFPEAAPFEAPVEGREIGLSTRLFEKIETGDRAIDPLYYPAYNSREGRRQLLLEPTYSEFMAAMQEALAEQSPRSALARAWMQSDLWSAYDILSEPLFGEDRSLALDTRHAAALDAVARMIRKLALTPEEIRSLPENYPQAVRALSLPDLFNPKSGWVEIQWFKERMHDSAAGDRRYARVFVKPVSSGKNLQKLLDGLRGAREDAIASVDGAAIVIQLFLIDSHGTITPTHLTSEVELRLFEKSPDGRFQKTQIRVCEMSRALLLRQPESGGLVSEDENTPAYADGYNFAAPGAFAFGSNSDAWPVVVKLRTRCIFCHGQAATTLLTFNMKMPARSSSPHVSQLDPAGFQAAEFALAQKAKSSKSLRAYF